MTAPELVSWEPRWTAPVVRSACPSCGRVADRSSGAWRQRRQPDGGMVIEARMSCSYLGGNDLDGLRFDSDGCFRTWDETVPVPRPPAPPTNPELWR